MPILTTNGKLTLRHYDYIIERTIKQPMENKIKTAYKGIYFDTKTEKYLVSTSFTTKDGYHIRTSKRGFETAKKAELWKKQKQIEYSNTNYQEYNNKLPFKTLAEKYLQYKGQMLKLGSIIQIRTHLQTGFLKFFENIYPDRITPNQVIAFYEYVSNLKIKNQSKNLILVHTLGFIEWLYLMEYISEQIYKKFKLILVKFPIIEQPVNNYLELDEFKLFISSFTNTREDKMLSLLFNTLFYGGMRKGEALALRYSDINYNTNIIHIDKQVQHYSTKTKYYTKIKGYYLLPYTKTNSIKDIEMPYWLIEYFQELQQIDNATSDNFIFILKDKIIGYDSLRMKLDQHLQQVGLKHIKIHDFRHSNTTLLYDMGADAKFVQERLGHSSPNTSLEIYNHLTKNRKATNSNIIKKL